MGRDKLFTKEEVLEAIQRHLLKRGVPPTVEELRKALSAGSTRTILRYLQQLEKDGDIRRWPGARGIRLRKIPKKGPETTPVPLVGDVRAGALTLAEENIEGWVRLPRDFLRRRDAKFFLLRVDGDSMNKARLADGYIEDGDLVLVEQQPVAESGDIVVALVDGEANIKRLRKATGYYVLQPESKTSKHEPIVLTQDFRIQGIVRRVLKKGSELLDFM